MPDYRYGRTLRERLLSRLVMDPSGCLLWTGAINTSGYGVIKAHGKQFRVHRLVWELTNGPIPEGLTLDHVKARGCRHRHCANVAHLEPVTMRENTLRGDCPAARYAVADRCVNGHAFDDSNTYVRRNGGRACRECHRIADRRWYRRARERGTR